MHVLQCVSRLARLTLIGRRPFDTPCPMLVLKYLLKYSVSEFTKYVLPLVHQHPVAWHVWQSGPGYSINMDDLLPLAAMHQAIKTKVSGTVSVSNASIAPHTRQRTTHYFPLGNVLEVWGGQLCSGSRCWWLTHAAPVGPLLRTTSRAVHYRCSLLWRSMACQGTEESQMVQATHEPCLCVAARQAGKFQAGIGASGAASFEPRRRCPRTEDHDSTTHIDVKLHAFFFRVGPG